MTKELVELARPDLEQEQSMPWGQANPRRGVRYLETAMAFVTDFPIGTVISTAQFDQWLHDHEMLVLPPEDAPKNSDAWLGHLQRRHIMRNRLNNSGTHSRMSANGSSPFTISSLGSAGFEIRAPHIEAQSGSIARRIASLTETKRHQLAHLLQSADFSALPPYQRVIAEQIYEKIDQYAEDTERGAARISQSLDRLIADIRRAVASGEIRPANGGIAQLIAPPPDGT